MWLLTPKQLEHRPGDGVEGLPNREGAKPGEIGGGRSGGTRAYAGWGYAGVTSSGLADRSEGSGQ